MKQDLDKKGIFLLFDDEGWMSSLIFDTLRRALNRAQFCFRSPSWEKVSELSVFEVDTSSESVTKVLVIHRDGKLEEF